VPAAAQISFWCIAEAAILVHSLTGADSRPDVAAMVVNNQVQKILLGHASTPQWFLKVRIIGRRVLVTTAWAQKPEEWEYLIALTTKLRAAAP
jgi:hypothetical protein